MFCKSKFYIHLVSLHQNFIEHWQKKSNIKRESIYFQEKQEIFGTFSIKSISLPYVKHQQGDNTSWQHQEILHLFHMQLSDLILEGLMRWLVMSNPDQISNIIPH